MLSLRAVVAALATTLALSAFAQPAPLTGDLAEIFAAAEGGDPEAQFYYAKRYYFGRGLPQDYEKAATWFLRSADQGNPEAQWYIAGMYARGEGVLVDESKARGWFERCADQDFPDCLSSLGQIYWDGEIATANIEKAKKYFMAGVKLNDGYSLWALGKMHLSGDGFPVNNAKGLDYWMRGARRGVMPAIIGLGSMFKEGGGVQKDEVIALKWFRIAAEKDWPDAIKERDELEKRLTPVQIKEATQLQADWTRIYNGGLWPTRLNVVEEFSLDIAVLEKRLVINTEADRSWLERVKKACADKSCSSSLSLADRKNLAAKGDPTLQNNYGDRLNRVATTPQQRKEALEYLSLAAKQGLPHAQVTLGWIYLHGLGVPRDVKAAFDWNMKGALQGHPEGATNIAFQYENGIGVAKSVEKAKDWYSYAAAKGSQIGLGSLRHLNNKGI